MFGVRFPSFRKGVIDNMPSLLIIILVIFGYTSCPLTVMFSLFTRCLPPWFALSLIRPFMFFALILLVNTYLLFCIAFSLNRVLFPYTLVLVFTLRTVSLSVNIVTCFRQLAFSCLPLLSHLTSGLMLSPLLLSSSTCSLIQLFRVLLLSSVPTIGI